MSGVVNHGNIQYHFLLKTMEENNNLDLRAVIGAFFLIISILLIVTSFIVENGSEINRNTGIVFLIFSLIMLLLTRKKDKKLNEK